MLHYLFVVNYFKYKCIAHNTNNMFFFFLIFILLDNTKQYNLYIYYDGHYFLKTTFYQ